MYIEDTPGSLTWLGFGSSSPLYGWTQKWDPRRRSTHTYLCKPPILLFIGSLLPRTLQKIHLFVIRDQWDSGIYTKFYNFKIIIFFLYSVIFFFLTWSVLVLWCFFSPFLNRNQCIECECVFLKKWVTVVEMVRPTRIQRTRRKSS